MLAFGALFNSYQIDWFCISFFSRRLPIIQNGQHVLQRPRNGCRGRIADMTVPEALRVDTDGGIKPDMAFLALLVECLPGLFLCAQISFN
jgi:hypothetical protein